MQEQIKAVRGAAAGYAKRNPREVQLSVLGALIGAGVGLTIGGVGIAGMGGAKGVNALAVVLILMAIFALVGNRIGVTLDRRAA